MYQQKKQAFKLNNFIPDVQCKKVLPDYLIYYIDRIISYSKNRFQCFLVTFFRKKRLDKNCFTPNNNSDHDPVKYYLKLSFCLF